jgi:hypothetical protein
MNKATKAALAATALVIGSSSLMAAPVHRGPAAPVQPAQDHWVQPIHLESTAVPAKQFFEELQRDGE